MRGSSPSPPPLALPALLDDGSLFPQRNLIVFLTFCVICVTLVLQGPHPSSSYRALGQRGAGPNCEEREARRIMIDAAVSHLNDAKEKDNEEAAAVYEDLVRHYDQRLASLQSGDGNPGPAAGHHRHLELSLEALRVERETAVRLRNEGRINDDILRRIERELDLSESRIATVRAK
jgi:CPA1 family monovalent cation:H+ antiporter